MYLSFILTESGLMKLMLDEVHLDPPDSPHSYKTPFEEEDVTEQVLCFSQAEV